MFIHRITIGIGLALILVSTMAVASVSGPNKAAPTRDLAIVLLIDNSESTLSTDTGRRRIEMEAYA
jgi:hypothetical protein